MLTIIFLLIASTLVHHVLSQDAEPFCSSIPMDDAITYQGKLRIFSGNKYWDVDAGSLPLKTPLLKDGKPVKHNIDAATDIGEGDQFIYFRKDTVYFMQDQETTTSKMPITEFVFGSRDHHPIHAIDAAWFNPLTKHLFLFHGDHYYEMEKSSAGKWTLVLPSDRLLVADLKIAVPRIDAAFTVADSLILVRDKWFFALPVANFMFPGVAYAASVALGTDKVGLFDTRRSCNIDQKTYADLLRRMENEEGLDDVREVGRDSMIYQAASDNQRRTAGPATDPAGGSPAAGGKQGQDVGKSEKKGKTQIWPYIVVVVLIVVLLVVAVYCIWIRKRNAVKSNDQV